ncbi:MAG: hypothetical protein JSW68_13440 [Burkholderiales bacterium]|nr:MAG: hypothetical protein JSW68_13440 [Burkholderiales bacterium]
MGSFGVALLEALLSAGVAPERAREVVELFDRSIDERFALHAQGLATRSDLAELEARLTRAIAELAATVAKNHGELETRMAEQYGQLDTRISNVYGQLDARISEVYRQLDARISTVKAEVIKWTVTALTAQTALLLGAIGLF